ncbi:MAG TPA: tetratricopeptide repeat protein [Flavobacteriales bacterium]|nr:tetratricopeptide repeat protein [Flavobacteriales bacterium]
MWGGLMIILVVRPISVLVHELGHGLAALYVTTGKVTLYAGSYGDPRTSVHFTIGRLEFHLSYNMFLTGQGLCTVEDKGLSVRRQMFYVVMGPLASLFLGLAALDISLIPDFHGGAECLCFFLGLFGLLDFVVNIIPRRHPIKLHNGKVTHNDGQQLRILSRHRSMATVYSAAQEHYNAGRFAEAAPLFHTILRKEQRVPMLYRLGISAYLQAKDFDNVRALREEFAQRFELSADDLVNQAYVKIQEQDLQGAVADMSKALEMSPHQVMALNNRGFTYELLGEYDKALADLDRAIELDGKFAYAYNNRGLVKVRLGRMEEGLRDLRASFELDGKNEYMFRNLGIYHFEMGEFAEAVTQFEKAAAMEKDTPLNAEYLEKARAALVTV